MLLVTNRERHDDQGGARLIGAHGDADRHEPAIERNRDLPHGDNQFAFTLSPHDLGRRAVPGGFQDQDLHVVLCQRNLGSDGPGG